MAFGFSTRRPEKHMPFYKMLDIFGAGGCPVCNLVARAVDGWFTGLLYENVNDRTMRARFARDVGMCNRHVHQLGGYNDGLAIGILYREIIAGAIRSLGGSGSDIPEAGGSGAVAAGGAASATGGASGPARDIATLPLHEGRCLVCDYERDTESRMIGIIADFIDDEEMRAGILRSQGLCLPHLARLAALLPGGGIPGWLADFHREKYETFLADLELYLESCNFTRDRNAAMPDRAQSLVWKKIPDRLTGYAGLPRYTEGRLKKGLAHAIFGARGKPAAAPPRGGDSGAGAEGKGDRR
jgi:hypothetical protein